VLVGAACVMLLAACAVSGAKPSVTSVSSSGTTPAAAPESTTGSEAPTEEAKDSSPSTAGDAEQALARAERELESALGPNAVLESKKPEELKPAPERAGALSQGGACETACRAYASMERAANNLCALAGAEDARCVAAKDRLSRASERVRGACGALCSSILR